MARKYNSNSNMPKVGQNSITLFQDKLTLIKITQKMVEGDPQKFETSFPFYGSIQPLQGRQLELKPEGSRVWGWWQVHCINSPNNMDVNDLIQWQGKKYKIMEKTPYDASGYVEYHVVEKYK